MAEPMGEKYDRYAQRTDHWLAVLAFVFLIVWSTRIIFFVSLPPVVRNILLVAQGWIWLVFLVDIIIRAIISKKSWRYLWTHPIDVIAVAVPAARPLKVLTAFTQSAAFATSKGRMKTMQAVAISVVLLIWIGSVAVLSAEGHIEDSQINTFGDALWWAVVTVTTVGYGDFAPVSVEGRIIAVIMMLLGIALIGVVTASVAAAFVRLTSEGDEVDDEQREQLHHDELIARIDRLEGRLERLSGGAEAPPPDGSDPAASDSTRSE
ncbi:potassium channel family protein [uncultured Demequina sp.]|mgnify:CR=1 FL=1|uniref:potassium channel family protein n=1 Tax=uncultured Demequina sp. TaxID=693499 RepID=UPI0025D9BA80|nr:potassium channel family protein [uncultured Demequina sp.]